MGIFTGIGSTSGTFTGCTAGDKVTGTAVFTGGAEQHVTSLVANVTVLAETNLLVVTPQWETSADGTTWNKATLPNAAAYVAIATGTSSADTAVTLRIPAPDLYSCNKVRLALVCTGATTGTTADTYSISYNYRDPSA